MVSFNMTKIGTEMVSPKFFKILIREGGIDAQLGHT